MGSCQAGAALEYGVGNGSHGIILADHSLVEFVL
jgi:hypothetical protein